MDEFSLYVLDITMNSVRAGADEILVSLVEEGDWLTFTVTDNGCGMSKEQVEKLSNPFFTTRKTRKVGLGVPFLLSAVLIGQLKTAFDWIKQNYRLINGICGGFLILVGVMMATGMLGKMLALLG